MFKEKIENQFNGSNNVKCVVSNPKKECVFIAIGIQEKSSLMLTSQSMNVISKILKQLRQVSQIEWCAFSGYAGLSYAEVKKSIEIVKENQVLIFYKGFNKKHTVLVKQILSCTEYSTEKYIEEIKKALFDCQREKLLDLVDKLFEEFSNRCISPQTVTNKILELQIQLNSLFLNRISVAQEDLIFYSNQIKAAATSIEVKKLFAAYLKCLLQSLISINGITRPEIISTVQYINANYEKQISLEEISNVASISKSYFCRLFKQETGMSYTDYINRVRIERAKLLIDSDTQKYTTEISELVGFEDYRYFCRIFKALTGMTCSQYKNNLRNDYL